MIVCPNCKHKALNGAMFCGECGASLENASDSITNTFDPPFNQSDVGVRTKDVAPESLAALFIPSFEACVNLFERKSYTIGRVSDEQEVAPEIDLTSYDAFQNGISRLHASLSIGQDGVYLLDLGSSNGSVINQRRLVPHVPYPLKDGDLIVFGKLQVRFVAAHVSP